MCSSVWILPHIFLLLFLCPPNATLITHIHTMYYFVKKKSPKAINGDGKYNKYINTELLHRV